MIRLRISNISLRIALALAAVPLVANACSSGHPTQPEGSTGTLSLPLVTTTNGHTYRLGGYLVLYGTIYDYLYLDGDETVLKRDLPAGAYFSYLNSYQLERLDESTGQYVPVQSTLVSSYYQPFTIYNQTTTTITYEFETDGVVVSIGTGNLTVNVKVTETAPVCTILGSDCPDGTWCAPPELTGSPLQCLYAGSVPAGDPCSGPDDCAANTSCFDFGDGAVCTALCDASGFGSACAGGGSCTQVGTAYGVCVPEGGSLPGSGGSGGSGGFGGSDGEEGGVSGGGTGGKGGSGGRGGRGM
jgi:hypothetical protein